MHSSGATRRRITSLPVAGSVARCVVTLRRGFTFGEPQGLQECEGNHGEQSEVVKARAALEMVEAEFLLHLLVSLLARPPSLDRSDDLLT